MKKWICADWHLGEDRFELLSRPFKTKIEHIKHLVSKHNELVGPDDEVIMVGDVCYQKAPEFLHYVDLFNGNKTLIRGNHDRVLTDEDFSSHFNTIVKEGEGIEMDSSRPSTCPFFLRYPTTVPTSPGAAPVTKRVLPSGVCATHTPRDPARSIRIFSHFTAQR